jgi:DegV family protein with EDD domain
MKIITDSAANLLPNQAIELGVHVVPFKVTFNEKTYLDGVDITPSELYRLYKEFPDEYPMTSQPSAGEFAAVYAEYPEKEIVSIHLSSGLSGSYSSGVTASAMIPGERITVVDTKTIGPAEGWLVEIAAFGCKRGWSKERILNAIRMVREHTLTAVSFSDIRFLIHSGRVSHLRGIIASVLKIKPTIGVNDVDGKFSTLGQDISEDRVVRRFVKLVQDRFGTQTIRLQLMHGDNLAGVEKIKIALSQAFTCVEDKLVSVTTVLGAHAGPTVIGLAAMPMSVWDRLRE